MMINQPEPVFSFTIPYYSSSNGETNELFISEKTYAKYLKVVKNNNVFFIHGEIHPISKDYGDVTTTLFDPQKAIIIIGKKDLEEYTTELLDLAIAQELEKVLQTNKNDFFRFLYGYETPDHTQTFIDDIQQTIEEIHIAKRLIKEGYRIHEREALLAQDILSNASQFQAIKPFSPFENEHGIFLVTKLIFLSYIDEDLYHQFKKQLHYPRLFTELEKLLQTIKKINLSTTKGREKALMKIFDALKYTKYIKKITITDIQEFKLPTLNM